MSPEAIARTALAAFRARHPEAATSDRVHAGSPARVSRFDIPGAYLLVPIYDDAGLRGVVQLDDEAVAVESSAAIRDPASVFLSTAETALRQAQKVLPENHGWQTPYLGWQPCRESTNSMRPLWVVPHSAGMVFVSQAGDVFETLTKGRGG